MEMVFKGESVSHILDQIKQFVDFLGVSLNDKNIEPIAKRKAGRPPKEHIETPHVKEEERDLGMVGTTGLEPLAKPLPVISKAIQITKDDLTAKFQELNAKAGINKVRELISKFGIERLGELDEKLYPDMLKAIDETLVVS